MYIISKVSGTGNLEKRYFLQKCKNIICFFNPTSTKTPDLGDPIKHIFFYNSVKKIHVYLTLQVNISGTGYLEK